MYMHSCITAIQHPDGISQNNGIYLLVSISSLSDIWQFVLGYMLPVTILDLTFMIYYLPIYY